MRFEFAMRLGIQKDCENEIMTSPGEARAAARELVVRRVEIVMIALVGFATQHASTISAADSR